MWWFAIPVVAIAAKKIYDAVTEGSSSSSTSYSDNVGEKEREARTAENIKRHNARAKRQQEHHKRHGYYQGRFVAGAAVYADNHAASGTGVQGLYRYRTERYDCRRYRQRLCQPVRRS